MKKYILMLLLITSCISKEVLHEVYITKSDKSVKIIEYKAKTNKIELVKGEVFDCLISSDTKEILYCSDKKFIFEINIK